LLFIKDIYYAEDRLPPIKAKPVVVRKTFLYFDVLKLARVFSFQIVNREKRRIFERIGRFYEFTFGISQKSDVLIY